MADKKRKVVLGALVAIQPDNGLGRVYLYRGAEVGDGFDKDDVKRLEELGLVGDEDGNMSAGVAVNPSA